MKLLALVESVCGAQRDRTIVEKEKSRNRNQMVKLVASQAVHRTASLVASEQTVFIRRSSRGLLNDMWKFKDQRGNKPVNVV